MVLDRVGGGGREKPASPAGWMSFGPVALTWLLPWVMTGDGRLNGFSVEEFTGPSLPGMSPDAAGVGGSWVRGICDSFGRGGHRMRD